MKKTLGVVAAAALAAAPAVAVFAANPTLSHTDTINLTVNDSCTLGTIAEGGAYTGTDATTHTHGSYTNAQDGSTDLGTWSGDTLSIAMQPGATSADIGSTTFTVRCNASAGYELKAVSGTINDSKAQLVFAAGNAAINSAVDFGSSKDATNGESYWNMKLSDASTGGMTIATGFDSAHAVPTEATKIASKSAAGSLNGETVKVTYGAGITNAQLSGTYEGSVVYTLVDLGTKSN